MTLVIMAAGMGSRYGGLKQLDPITRHGEFIIDFSIYDALQAGFDKVVFIIKRENYDAFSETVGRRISGQVKTEYVFQELDALPDGISLPAGRKKPWGTAHAVLCAQSCVDDNFAVINADDFYGRDAFRQISAFYRDNSAQTGSVSHFAMAGYVLQNTLTDNGYVSRGVCESGKDGLLRSITERKQIIRRVDGNVAFYEEDSGWNVLDENTVVSMNCWGFTPAIFGHIREGFARFFSAPGFDPEKSEYYLPSAVTEMMQAGGCDVHLLNTTAKWYGVTYHEDKESVTAQLQRMVYNGTYPDGLWN